MPNPFPGMNPYLEDPLHWRVVHHRLIGAIDEALNRDLPPGFVADIDERVYVEGWGKDYYPDNVILETEASPRTSSGTAVLERSVTVDATFDAPFLLSLNSQTIHESFVEIRTTDDSADLVVAIEILSPTNKEEGPGRDDYRRKQRDVMNSWVHLVEIDLLRAGAYTLAPEEIGTRLRVGRFDYIVSLHRGGQGNTFEVWPTTVRQRLPRIRVPLVNGLDVPLDLQEVVNHAYISRERSLRYDREPVPPLSSDDAAWADALLREKGLR